MAWAGLVKEGPTTHMTREEDPFTAAAANVPSKDSAAFLEETENGY